MDISSVSVISLHKGDGAKFIDDLYQCGSASSPKSLSFRLGTPNIQIPTKVAKERGYCDGQRIIVYRQNVYENIFSEVLERLFEVRFSNYNPANFAENNGIDHLGYKYWWLAKWPMEIHLDLDDLMINDLFVEIALDQVRIMEQNHGGNPDVRGEGEWDQAEWTRTTRFWRESFDDLLRWQPFTFSGRLSYKTQLEIEHAYGVTKQWGRTIHDTHFTWHDGFPAHPRTQPRSASEKNAPLGEQA